MTETSIKVPEGRNGLADNDDDDEDGLASSSKRPRTAEDFYLFCSFILEYEKYEVLKREEVEDTVNSPLGSTDSATDSITDSLDARIAHSPTQSLTDDIKTENMSANGVDDDSSSSSESQDDVKPGMDSVCLQRRRATAPQRGGAQSPGFSVHPPLSWVWQAVTCAAVASTSDEDSYDLVTCYCAKPFAGRPMIECSKCLTWIHLSCAKIKKNNIPDIFICIKCKNQKINNIPTNSSFKAKKRVSM